MLPEDTNVKVAYANGIDTEQQFIQDLALFFCTFLKEHGSLIEKQQNLQESLLKSLHYLLLISQVEETEIFKICLEYWNALCSELYRESPFSSTASPLFLSRPSPATPQRRHFYQPVLTKVRSDWLYLYCTYSKTKPMIFFGRQYKCLIKLRIRIK